MLQNTVSLSLQCTYLSIVYVSLKTYLFPVYALPAVINIQIYMLIKPFCYTLQNQNADQSEIEGLPFLIPPDVAAQRGSE